VKKVRKITRAFRYDLNQIPYDYTMEVRNRFKGLDLIDRVPDELWKEVRDTVQETRIKTIPKKKKCKKAKWLSEESLQIAVKRREAKSKGEKERYKHLNAEFQRIARRDKRDKKAFFSNQSKEIEENNGMGKTRNLFKTNRDTKGIFHAKMGSIKDRNGMDLTEAEDIKKRWQEYTEELYKKDLHDHYIYYCRQESLRRNGVAIMVNKRVCNTLLGCNLKNDRKISVHFQGKPFNITVIKLSAPTRLYRTQVPFLMCGESVQFSCSVISNYLQPHGLQYARLPCLS